MHAISIHRHEVSMLAEVNATNTVLVTVWLAIVSAAGVAIGRIIVWWRDRDIAQINAKSQVDRAQTDINGGEITKLWEHIDKTEKRCNRLEEVINAQNATISGLNSINATQNSELHQLRVENRDLRSHIARLENAIKCPAVKAGGFPESPEPRV